jgi:hypothetical protein
MFTSFLDSNYIVVDVEGFSCERKGCIKCDICVIKDRLKDLYRIWCEESITGLSKIHIRAIVHPLKLTTASHYQVGNEFHIAQLSPETQ